MKQAYSCHTCRWQGVAVVFDQDKNILRCPRCGSGLLAQLYEGGRYGLGPLDTDLPLQKDMPPHTPAGALNEVNPRAKAVAGEQAGILVTQTLRLLGYMVRHKMGGTEVCIDAIRHLRYAWALTQQPYGYDDSRNNVIDLLRGMYDREAEGMLVIAGISTPQDVAERVINARNIIKNAGIGHNEVGKVMEALRNIGRTPTDKDATEAEREEWIMRIKIGLQLDFKTVAFKLCNLADDLSNSQLEYIYNAVCLARISPQEFKDLTVIEILKRATKI